MRTARKSSVASWRAGRLARSSASSSPSTLAKGTRGAAPLMGSLQPRKKVLRPRKKVLRPRKKVLRPRKKVLRPRKKVLRPRKKVLRPRKKVLRPSRLVFRRPSWPPVRRLRHLRCRRATSLVWRSSGGRKGKARWPRGRAVRRPTRPLARAQRRR